MCGSADLPHSARERVERPGCKRGGGWDGGGRWRSGALLCAVRGLPPLAIFKHSSFGRMFGLASSPDVAARCRNAQRGHARSRGPRTYPVSPRRACRGSRLSLLHLQWRFRLARALRSPACRKSGAPGPPTKSRNLTGESRAAAKVRKAAPAQRRLPSLPLPLLPTVPNSSVVYFPDRCGAYPPA
eukprot:353245-Chlamydomonas_euryale.AAC.7